MGNYADDTYLVVPASNNGLCANEIAYIENFSHLSDVSLKHGKSAEIVFWWLKSR